MASPLFRGNRRLILFEVALLTALIAVADWRVDADVPLGFLYLLPILIASGVLDRVQIAVLGLCCTILAEAFDGFHWSPLSGIPRDVMYFAAFSGIGLFAHEVASRRRAATLHLQQIEAENLARREAEEQLKVLVESSPIAIFTTDAEGSVLLANDAAHRLFGIPPESLLNENINRYLPALTSVPALRSGQPSFRTAMQCSGHRHDGEIFIADVWFSTYRTSAGPRLAAMVVDASEDVRDREEAGLHQLLAGSRILMGAVSHEIRNVCGAIAVVHENLARNRALAHDQDFKALGTLVLALERIAALELRQMTNQATTLDLQSFLEELTIIIGPPLREEEIDVQWDVPANLPPVWADRQSLMQVFLNLFKNSERVLSARSGAWVRIHVAMGAQRVLVFVSDNGGGVRNPEELFRPFQHQAQASGLGLYLSRALMRSFGGDLHYEPGSEGATFVVEIAPIVNLDETNERYGAQDQALLSRRS